MTVKGVIRLKCVDLANWAANQGLFNDVSTADSIRYGTEGMDTVMVYVAKAQDMATMKDELATAMEAAMSKFTGMDTNFDMLMGGAKAILDAKTMEQSFSMQLRTTVPYYIEVVINVVE